MIIIDGTTYNVPVVSLKRKADFLDKYAERTEDGELHRELIGVYFNYELKFGRDCALSEYQSLWSKLTEATEFHTVVIPDGATSTYTFTAYFANVGDELIKEIGADNYWRNLTVNLISKSPRYT